MFSPLSFLVQVRLVRRSVAASLFQNAGYGPDAPRLVLKVSQARSIAGRDAEVILLRHRFPELLRLGRRKLAVRTEDQANARPVQADLIDLWQCIRLLIRDLRFRSEDLFEP